jgi:hypothetical protein
MEGEVEKVKDAQYKGIFPLISGNGLLIKQQT